MVRVIESFSFLSVIFMGILGLFYGNVLFYFGMSCSILEYFQP